MLTRPDRQRTHLDLGAPVIRGPLNPKNGPIEHLIPGSNPPAYTIDDFGDLWAMWHDDEAHLTLANDIARDQEDRR